MRYSRAANRSICWLTDEYIARKMLKLVGWRGEMALNEKYEITEESYKPYFIEVTLKGLPSVIGKIYSWALVYYFGYLSAMKY